jgi:RHS repeat-associated protein
MKHIIHQFRTGALFIVNFLKLFIFRCSLFIVSCSLFISPLSFSQPSPSAGRSAIMHSKFRVAESGGVATQANAVTTIQYYDGLGNPTQNVGYRMSPTGKDIVLSVTTYDKALRPYRTYLPFGTSGTNGGYHTNSQTTASAFYDDTVPYNEILRYDYSPNNEPRITRGPGKAWQQNNRIVTIQNSASVVVKFITTDASGNLVFNNRYYPVNSYQRETVLDEQNKSVATVKDVSGKLIMIRDGSNGITHYVYDQRDRLSAVIQPEGYDFGTTGITKNSDLWQKYVFGYEYDLRNRIIRKHIPGAGWTEIVYDNADRPVMTQDASQKALNRWSFTQYDAFGREIARGETTKVTTRAAAQTLFNSHPILYEKWMSSDYSELSFPAVLKPTSVEIEQYNFYDIYGFIATEFSFDSVGTFHNQKGSAKGLLTGVSKRNSADDNRYYTDTYYYDDLNRVIQSQHTHQLSAGNQQNVIVSNKEYNFANEVTKEYITYPFTTGTVSTAQHNSYDHAGRIIQIDYGISTSPEVKGPSSFSPEVRTTEAKGGKMYSTGFKWPKNGRIPQGNASLSDGFTLPTLTKLITYSYDEVGRMSEKRYMPDGTYSLGNPDYIYLPPSPSGTTENKARKAVILEPGTLIEASSSSTYLAGIDSTVSDIPPFSSLQQQRYSWHIRGGLAGINLNPSGNPVPDMTKGDLFAYKLEYEAAGQWNGNIGRQSWNHILGTEPEGVRRYLFAYDGNNQLKSAAFSGLPGENYSLAHINYDKNGNITTLQRNGKTGSSFGLMDNLNYTYSGNRLSSVNDAISGNHEVDFVKRGAGAYTYWENGSLKSDQNEQIANITYNTFLNQPEQVTLSDGRWIKHTYDGSGALIKTEYSNGEYWEFTHGMIFKNGEFYQMAIPEGRAIYEAGAWKPEFDYKDHLGNTRVSFKADGNRLVHTAKTDTDPWGVILKTGQENSFQNRHEMQGHEREKTFGLNRINFGARTYNPTIGRFDKVDRYSEKYTSLSTFHYAANNPINIIDINGDSLVVFKDGKYTTTLDDGKKEITGFNQQSRVGNDGQEELFNGQSFTFNDYENDRTAIISGEFQLRFVSGSEVYNVIQESGVMGQTDPWKYIERESRPIGETGILSSSKSKGKMDFQNFTQRQYNSLNIVDGVAYNNPDYGNFLWGQAGKLLGFSLRTLKNAAHVNNAFNSKQDNPGLPYSILDSPGDQRAIKSGYKYLLRRPKGLSR